jgi:hypothetical protein
MAASLKGDLKAAAALTAELTWQVNRRTGYRWCSARRAKQSNSSQDLDLPSNPALQFKRKAEEHLP